MKLKLIERHIFPYCYHVERISYMDGPDFAFHFMFRNKNGKFELKKLYDKISIVFSYPIKQEVHYEIKGDIGYLSDILIPAAIIYRTEIYMNCEKYQVWGHELSDLWYESIDILLDEDTGEYFCDLGIGS